MVVAEALGRKPTMAHRPPATHLPCAAAGSAVPGATRGMCVCSRWSTRLAVGCDRDRRRRFEAVGVGLDTRGLLSYGATDR